MKNYFQYQIQCNDSLDSESIIAIVSQSEAESFEEENGIVKAYIHEDKNVAELEEILRDYQLKFDKQIIEQQNWNALWESSYEAVTVDDFCEIIAPFHEPKSNAPHLICINPGMAFGTGHHATTSMMILQMQHMNFEGKQVLDYGTGSAVLAVLAEKMKSSSVIGLEIDDWACRNAEENIARNHCEKVSIICGTLEHLNAQHFDIILANINKNVLLDSCEQISAILDKNGLLLLSGFYENDIQDIFSKYQKHGFELSKIETKNNWACILLRRNI